MVQLVNVVSKNGKPILSVRKRPDGTNDGSEFLGAPGGQSRVTGPRALWVTFPQVGTDDAAYVLRIRPAGAVA